MRITPLDIQQVAFRIKMRGYDRQEVDSFLDSVTEDYEELVRENNSLKEKVADFEGQVAELKKKEGTLNSTLMQAQDVVEGMKSNAQKDAELVLREAELKAEAFARSARDEMVSLQREILDLQKQKAVFIEKTRSIIKSFERILELEDREDEKKARTDKSEDERDDNIRFLKPKS